MTVLAAAHLWAHVVPRHSRAPNSYAGRWIETKLRGNSRISENIQPSSYQTAAALDAAQPLRPAGQKRPMPAQQHASTWDHSLQHPYADSSLPEDGNKASNQGVQDTLHSMAAEGRVAGPGYVHVAFGAFFSYLGFMTAAATSADWYLDTAAFGGLWAVLWFACARWFQPSITTVVLLCLLPVMHLSGALGTYHWELGNLSWDILTHITNGFLGTLLFAAVLKDISAANSRVPTSTPVLQEHSTEASEDSRYPAAKEAAAGAATAVTAGPAFWRERVWGVVTVTGLLLISTMLIEVLEAAGGQLAGHAGEGIFLRGPGDLCTVSLPCSEEVDTAKDMLDNCAGMILALLALATRGANSASATSGNSSRSSA